MKIKYWHPKKIRKGKGSPSREYADEFLYENLGSILTDKEIKILDIGCGSGYIRKIFHDLGYKIIYTGIDIEKHKDFEQFDKYALNSDFIKQKAEDFETSEKYNLVFSFFALEHIENDFLAVSKADKLLEKRGIQIHFVPALWSLFLYFRHGYRRYTQIRLKKIFGENFTAYKLGGFFSFFLHIFFITIPEIILKNNKPRQSNIYPTLLSIANKFDHLLPIFSSVYIVICSKQD